MKKLDLAYMAGFFDGEGSISLYLDARQYRISVSMSNTNEWVVQWFHLNFGGSLYLEPKHIKNPNHRDAWRWQLIGKRSMPFLELLFPYLRLKREQAKIVMEFQHRRKPNGDKTIEARALDEADRILMSSYNCGKGRRAK